MKKTLLALTVAVSLITTSCRTGEPKQLSGHHRQPINVQPVVVQAPEDVFPEASLPVYPNLPAAAAAQPVIVAAPPSPVQVVAANPSAQSSYIDTERVFRIFFDYGNANLRISGPTQAELLPLAQSSRQIFIKGRTDGTVFSASDERLAMRRALAMRTYLIQQGVNPTKIYLQFASATDYLADNSTTAGRDQNRRVEVVLDLVKSAPTS